MILLGRPRLILRQVKLSPLGFEMKKKLKKVKFAGVAVPSDMKMHLN